jgi:hypothetical protein
VKKLTDDVSHELARFGPAGDMPTIVEAWPVAVGPTIARNAWPARIARDRTLHVATSSSSWAFELAQLEADILRRLRDAAGAKAPPRVRFAVGKLPERGLDETRDSSARGHVEPGPDEVRKGAELAAEIADEELRKLVAKAAAQSLAKAGSDHPF